MNEKLIELYDRCKKHNINISIKTCLSDACLKIQAECLAYCKRKGEYEHIRYMSRISIDDIGSSNIDIFEMLLNSMIRQISMKRKELQSE